MRSSQASDPLVNVGLSYAYEVDGSMRDETRSKIEQCLVSYLNQSTSFYSSIQVFNALLGTTKPIDRISAILQVPDNPIPNYLSCHGDKHSVQIWTNYEDLRLLAALHKFGLNNWEAVALFIGNSRTKSQCVQRWTRVLNPCINRNKWTMEEEEKLEYLVKQFGLKRWNEIAEVMGDRTDAQCRYHYKMIRGHKQASASESSFIQKKSIIAIAPIANETLQFDSEFAYQPKVTIPSIKTFLDNI